MQHGFIKTAAVTPRIRVADPIYNAGEICKGIDEAVGNGAKVIVFPELCLTGYTCGDLFLQEALLMETRVQLLKIVQYTEGRDAVVFVGLPLERENKLYNVAAAIQDGEILAFIPKTNIPGYAEFYEGRHFAQGNAGVSSFFFDGEMVPFGTNLLLECEGLDGLIIGCEICEDVWVAQSPGTSHALAGATLLVNLSASSETIGKAEYRRMLVQSTSARLLTGYIYANAGEGESTQDIVFGGHNLIAENGVILAESKRFVPGILYGDVDIHRIRMERRKTTSFQTNEEMDYIMVPFSLQKEEVRLDRVFDCMPFVPNHLETRRQRCEEILSIQSMGLKKRMEHVGVRTVLLGVSGGLDSTLALLVVARAFDLLGMERSNILAVTMPCFGTTNRTYENACKLSQALGAALEEINIREAVSVHFRDIKQDQNNHDVTYENGQARERTQVLMDLANQRNGIVIGTGDMSELALGFATYNGDHMSMYGVNSGVPKTLVRHLVQYYADTCNEAELRAILVDILETPVSPELLPPENGTIAQKTEDIVGPYELHDFFLYYMLRCGFEPAKVFRIAVKSFAGQYDQETIMKWLKLFYRRFFTQQFKRSCLPDGPKVGSVAVSPRGDLRMPSDASMQVWVKQLEEMDLEDR